MNKLLSLFAIILFLTACKGGKEEEKAELDKKITKRAYHINAENAYNNLFFDSLVLEKFLVETKSGDSIIRRMRSFYNARNFQYAWLSPEGLTEQARGFWNLYSYHNSYIEDSLTENSKLNEKMSRMVADESFKVTAADKGYLNTELTLTKAFILYALNTVEDGYIKRKEMEKFIPIQKQNALEIADSLVNKKHKDDKYYSDVNQPYAKLKEALKIYVDIAKAGGWPLVTSDAALLKKGSTAPEIKILKNRLQISRDLDGADTSAMFTPQLESAIRNFQQRIGYEPTGELTKDQLEELNIPVEKRIGQLLINLGRMQWAIHKPEGKLISVNIPEFLLRVRDGDKEVFNMAVVVGKVGHNTTMFTGNLNQVVFSPYWNVPISITKNEIVPGMNRNAGYLDRQNMEIVGQWGNGLPKVRQKPGPKNSLGKVKFLFPNSFDIYFHDTPSKSLFDKDMRAFSHGCIRLSEPEKMANYLLKDDSNWPASKITAAMNSGKEKYVKLDEPVPVIISYYTAWVDENSRVHFARDIYDHDEKMAKKMFF